MVNAGETFNFSSKNFSCSLRRPEYIARPATRRGEIKIHATVRLFSAACLRGIHGGVLQDEARAMKDAAVHRRASTKRETRRDSARKCGEFTQICKSNSFPASARALSCQLPFLNRLCFCSCTCDGMIISRLKLHHLDHYFQFLSTYLFFSLYRYGIRINGA